MHAGERAQITWKGLAVAVVVALVAGILLGGSVFGFGGQGDGAPSTPNAGQETDNPTKTHNMTQSEVPTSAVVTTAKMTPTSIETPSPTVTSTSTTTPDSKDTFREFQLEFQGELRRNANVPLHMRAATVREGNYYLVHNSTSQRVNDTKKFIEWTSIALAYGATVRDHDRFDKKGSVPKRLIVLEYNSSNLTNRPDKFIITNKNVWGLVNNNITAKEYHKRWQNSLQPQSDDEVEFALKLDRALGNVTLHPVNEDQR